MSDDDFSIDKLNELYDDGQLELDDEDELDEREEVEPESNGKVPDKALKKLVVQRADYRRMEPIHWAWDGRIPLGFITALVGQEGVGKGNLIAQLLGQLSQGELSGDLYGQPTVCAIIGTEDSWHKVWLPRLKAAGADARFVHHIGHREAIDLRRDRGAIRQAVKQHGIRVLYLDALLDHLGGDVDAHASKPVRNVLMGTAADVDELDCALVVTVHGNKQARSFRQFVTASHAIIAVARSALLVSRDPDDSDRRLLTTGKNNFAPIAPALGFRIEQVTYPSKPKAIVTSRAVDLQQRKPIHADEVIARLNERKPESKGKSAQARAVIRRHLKDGQRHRAGPIIKECEALGLSRENVRKLARKMGVQSQPRAAKQGGSDWWLE